MSGNFSVMLVEDSPAFRLTINQLLDNEPDIELIGEFGTAEFALRSLQSMSTRIEPNLILLDLRLPGMDGLDALPFFTSALPSSKVLILTQSDKDADILRAVSLGASGYLLKSSSADNIISAIRSALDGGTPFDSNVTGVVIDTLKNKLPKNEDEQLLTDRELDVLELLAEGLMKKDIAQELSISYTTVDSHVSHIYNKLNVPNAPAAINKAHQLNLFPQKRK
jgi:DNA-binding NarL/FixJ family response regulator